MDDEKNDDFVRVMLPRSLKAKIQERAKATRRSVSAWCRFVLEKHFDQLEAPPVDNIRKKLGPPRP